MELRRFQTIEEFYRWAAPFLLEREAEHNLILGICAHLIRYPEQLEQPPYLAGVEWDGSVVAAALMIPPNNFVLSHVTAPEAIPLIAENLSRVRSSLPAVVGSVPFSGAFAEEWHGVSGQPYHLFMPQRIYRLEKVVPIRGVQGSIRRATEHDRNLLLEWFVAFNEEALGETDTTRIARSLDCYLSSYTLGLYLWEDGQPVSMAGHSRPTPNGVCVNAVYTPPEHRRKGYASACVAALSQMLLDSGRKFCCLKTDLANPTSNSIYQAIGYEAVCDSAMYKFGDRR